ncbi:dynamin family protein [Nonomuraea sp. WAC 01424]|uniref:dynamin family protein n=1 Tax=Nonomuraea sp. WAC 01424 TaxID=2203200 RepID=UPI0021ADF514|nr:dynamin family protein [Nonomuraea sp. WAC 01424]
MPEPGPLSANPESNAPQAASDPPAAENAEPPADTDADVALDLTPEPDANVGLASESEPVSEPEPEPEADLGLVPDAGLSGFDLGDSGFGAHADAEPYVSAAALETASDAEPTAETHADSDPSADLDADPTASIPADLQPDADAVAESADADLVAESGGAVGFRAEGVPAADADDNPAAVGSGGSAEPEGADADRTDVDVDAALGDADPEPVVVADGGPGVFADADYPTDPGDPADDEDGRADADDVPTSGDPESGTAEAPQRVEELAAETVEALTSALGALRESVSDLRFGLDLPGADEARQARADLLAQLENYVLPRVRTNTAPALIVIAGSTGAGKSTLVNSLAERNISRTGVRRPTTGTPILACHPDDRKWFTEGELLSGLERLERPSPESGMDSLVVVATEKLPQGVALLDTPDIDSVVEEHHEIAHRMLDAADLWIFVTTAARYADAPAWSLLRLAKERGARLAIVLSRVQPRSADVVLKHFVRMLTEYGLGDIDRFVIHEAPVSDGRLPDSEVTDLRLWLAELSVDESRRAQAVHETLNGVLNSFRTRVPALARHLEGQVAFRGELRSDVEAAYLGALAEIDKASKNGSLLHGEVLARWQDFAGSGDLMRSLQFRKGGKAAGQTPERVLAFKAAIRTGLESVIVAAANRAAEEVVARWRHRSELGVKLAEGLDSPSDNLLRHAGRAIASWQDHLNELVRTEGVTKRSVSKLVSFDPDALSLIFTVAMFSGGDGSGVPHRLVNALLGAESLRGIGAKALSDLRARIGMLFDEESMRYVHALDSAGIPDESVATRLYQAAYNLEVAR